MKFTHLNFKLRFEFMRGINTKLNKYTTEDRENASFEDTGKKRTKKEKKE